MRRGVKATVLEAQASKVEMESSQPTTGAGVGGGVDFFLTPR